MKKERGSALIIAMLLIAVVGGLAFGIVRLLLAETISAARYENGAVAYLAAESGLEEAFLRYKIDRNSEIPEDYTLAASRDNHVYRTNLTGNSVDTGGAGVTIGIKNTAVVAITDMNEYYDLRMGYVGTLGKPFLGHDVDGDGQMPILSFNTAMTNIANYAPAGDYALLKVPFDQSYKVTLDGYDFAADLDLGLKFYSPLVAGTYTSPFNATDLDADHCKAIAEIKFTVYYQASSSTKEYKALLVPAQTCTSTYVSANGSSISNVGLLPAFSHTMANSESPKTYYLDFINIQQVIDTLGRGTLPDYTQNDKVTLSVKPLNYDAAIALARHNAGTYCDADTMTATSCSTKKDVPAGPYSSITSIGHYGGITKTLQANLDRGSGTVYDLYDFVLFKGN